LEVARLERCVPLVNSMAHDFELNGNSFVTIFGQEIRSRWIISPLFVQNANRDGKIAVVSFEPELE
jgi:hypothetical protein